MTAVFLTVDTELSALLYQQRVSTDHNFAASILGRTSCGDFGIGWQMDVLNRYGLKGVYFIDPMPVMVVGEDPIARTVDLVLQHGHDVQLHLHSEWLEWAENPPIAARGQNIGAFPLEDQISMIAWARDMLIRCGAPAPAAFRAGNFGANDDTLRALAHLGIRWDSSYNASYAGGGPCTIGLKTDAIDPVDHCGITEIPVSAIWDRPGHLRPAQICALSSAEMRAGLTHAAMTSRPTFMIVTHSFEMLSRDRRRPNYAVIARFEEMCRTIAETDGLWSCNFADMPAFEPSTVPSRAPASMARTLSRMGQQALANWRYERRLRPV